MSYNKLLAGIISYSLLACAVCGCAAAPETTTESSQASSVSDSITYLDAADMFTKRDKQSDYASEDATEITLSDSKSTCDSPAVRVSDNQITITRTGTYVLSGSLTNGQIVVDASGEKVQIVLKDASINCDTSAAIYVKSADKVFVTLAENTSNTLTNTKDFVAIDDNNIDAVIFSKSDLSLNGSGTLTIHAAYGHGIVSKDDLVITSGTYDITAARHALSGKDSVRIADGIFTLNAKKDGIHSENTDNDEKGFIYIADGTFSITCDSDGMDAEETLQVDGGTITIAAGDDGLHADGDLVLNDGTITITKSYEGLEGKTVTITGGSYAVTSSDDGVNAPEMAPQGILQILHHPILPKSKKCHPALLPNSHRILQTPRKCRSLHKTVTLQKPRSLRKIPIPQKPHSLHKILIPQKCRMPQRGHRMVMEIPDQEAWKMPPTITGSRSAEEC